MRRGNACSSRVPVIAEESDDKRRLLCHPLFFIVSGMFSMKIQFKYLQSSAENEGVNER